MQATGEDIQRVWEEWRDRRDKPALCRFTEERRELIERRLRSFSADDLVMLIEYACEADTVEARFWRGDNGRHREYLDLENLLRAGKIAGRVERAFAWKLEADTSPAPQQVSKPLPGAVCHRRRVIA